MDIPVDPSYLTLNRCSEIEQLRYGGSVNCVPSLPIQVIETLMVRGTPMVQPKGCRLKEAAGK